MLRWTEQETQKEFFSTYLRKIEREPEKGCRKVSWICESENVETSRFSLRTDVYLETIEDWLFPLNFF